MKLCKLEGCEKKVKALGLCQMHYVRQARHVSKALSEKDEAPVQFLKIVGCKVDGCGGRVRSLGLCGMHYSRQLRKGSTFLAEKPTVCVVDGCENKPRSLGMCQMHYDRKLRHSDPLCSRSYFTEPHETVFMKYVEKPENESDCWNWKGAMTNGYGKFRMGLKSVTASRAAWLLFMPPDPDFSKKLVCHSCDNPRCVNIAHLFLGTTQDNVDDKIIKKRFWSKLDEDKVRIIRNSTNTHVSLALRFGVAASTVASIRNSQKWKHVL